MKAVWGLNASTTTNYAVPVEWEEILPRAIPIKKRKFDDLQSIKHVMPAECHDFFDNLPHL